VLKGKGFQAILGITDHKVFKIFVSAQMILLSRYILKQLKNNCKKLLLA